MIGFTLGAVFFGSIAFAATTKIEASLDPIKFIIDNVDKTPLNGNFNNNGTSVPASLSYKGTTYVPLKMVSNMIDKNVACNRQKLERCSTFLPLALRSHGVNIKIQRTRRREPAYEFSFHIVWICTYHPCSCLPLNFWNFFRLFR